MAQNKQPENRLNIELSDDVAEGTYSNLAVISHSASEFIVDFVRVMPGVPKAPVKSRIVMNPENAKRLMKALQENIGKFEKNFGKINENKGGPNVPMNFGGPAAKA
ncbi:MAG: DUF3467 domain-containing protein [Bacteroidota bacterium]|nr:DUF3467 domain-containing protein [Bacteroidota bacterium]